MSRLVTVQPRQRYPYRRRVGQVPYVYRSFRIGQEVGMAIPVTRFHALFVITQVAGNDPDLWGRYRLIGPNGRMELVGVESRYLVPAEEVEAWERAGRLPSEWQYPDDLD